MICWKLQNLFFFSNRVQRDDRPCPPVCGHTSHISSMFHIDDMWLTTTITQAFYTHRYIEYIESIFCALLIFFLESDEIRRATTVLSHPLGLNWPVGTAVIRYSASSFNWKCCCQGCDVAFPLKFSSIKGFCVPDGITSRSSERRRRRRRKKPSHLLVRYTNIIVCYDVPTFEFFSSSL